jgi:hypothetical protein
MQNGHRPSNEPPRRTALFVVLVIAVALLSFGAGLLLAPGDEAAAPTPSPQPSPSPSATTSPTTSPEPTASTTPSGETGELGDGRHFVYATSATSTSLTFDLAYFLTGDAASAASAEHGGEVPPPNGYYIVNDNDLLRTLPVSPSVVVRYIPAGAPDQTQLQTGNYPAFVGAVNGTVQTDYPDMAFAPWWITVTDGQIVKIQQQYLP